MSKGRSRPLAAVSQSVEIGPSFDDVVKVSGPPAWVLGAMPSVAAFGPAHESDLFVVGVAAPLRLARAPAAGIRPGGIPPGAGTEGRTRSPRALGVPQPFIIGRAGGLKPSAKAWGMTVGAKPRSLLRLVVSGGPASADERLLAYRYFSLRTGRSNQNQCSERGYAGDNACPEECSLEPLQHAFRALAGAGTGGRYRNHSGETYR